jgi:hypothetical protein
VEKNIADGSQVTKSHLKVRSRSTAILESKADILEKIDHGKKVTYLHYHHQIQFSRQKRNPYLPTENPKDIL